MSEQTEMDMSQIPLEEQERINEINELIQAERLDPTTSMNILINAVQVSYDKDHFNELDRYLIAKALNCFKEHVDAGENFTINVRDESEVTDLKIEIQTEL
jgi:hypothetical protein